jgi:hypothetical protein
MSPVVTLAEEGSHYIGGPDSVRAGRANKFF